MISLRLRASRDRESTPAAPSGSCCATSFPSTLDPLRLREVRHVSGNGGKKGRVPLTGGVGAVVVVAREGAVDGGLADLEHVRDLREGLTVVAHPCSGLD